MSDKILVIEDDKSVLELCRKIFEKNDYEVRLINNPKDTFFAIEKEYFHAVLSDIKMPDIDGIALLTKIKNKYPELPVVLMTADSTVDLAIKALKTGASDYILKPFDTNELLSVIKNVIEHSKIKKHLELSSHIISMYEFSNELIKDKSQKELLDFILKRACNILNADYGAIYEYNENIEKMELQVKVGACAENLMCADIKYIKKQTEPFIEDSKIQSSIIMPILLKSRLIGTFHFNRNNGKPFTVEEKYAAKIFSSHAALIIGRFYSIKEKEEYNNMKAEFISNVSHELRTPLMAISGAIELLALTGTHCHQNSASVAGQNNFIDIIQRNTGRMNKLIMELLDFNKIENNNIRYNFNCISAEKIITQSFQDFQSPYNAKGVGLSLVIPKSPPTIFADEGRIIQVLGNLLSNALKFSNKNTNVILGLKTGVKNVIIFVKDEGPGIENIYHEKIFDKFFQIDGSTKRDAGGFGLGLAIVKSIVEAHKGKIRIKSELGKGTTFCVILPEYKND